VCEIVEQEHCRTQIKDYSLNIYFLRIGHVVLYRVAGARLTQLFFGVSMSESGLTDAELICSLRNNDLEALGTLFDRYYVKIYRTAMAITHDSHVAEDITQDCFLKLHHYADRIDTTLPLSPWLYRVTINLSYTWVSRQKKRRASLEAVVDRLMSPLWHTPDRMAEHQEVQHQVRQAIRELNFQQRVVVVLHYLNNLSLDDIAEILDCPVGTVKSRLYYARENLRRKLGPTFAEQTAELGRPYAGFEFTGSQT